jgi:hypothetical protein
MPKLTKLIDIILLIELDIIRIKHLEMCDKSDLMQMVNITDL